MKKEFILSKPFAGWSKVCLEGIETKPCSYLTDIPLDFMLFFCDWYESSSGEINIDFESYGQGVFKISDLTLKFTDSENCIYRRLSYGDIVQDTELLSENIALYLDDWSLWHINQYDIFNIDEYNFSVSEFMNATFKLKNYLKMCGGNISYCNYIINNLKEFSDNHRKSIISESKQ